MDECGCAGVYGATWMCACMRMYACVYVCMNVCMYVCMCVCLYTGV